MRARLFFLIYVALFFFLGMVHPGLAEGPKWVVEREIDHFSIRTQNWVLRSWASRSRTLACAKQLEAVRKNLFEIFGLASGPRAVLEVLILEDDRSFLAYSKENLGEVQYIGGYWSANKNQVVTWDRQDVAVTLRILSHELTHYFVHQVFPSPPLWLDEGLSEYVGSSQIRWGRLKGGFLNEVHRMSILNAAQARTLIPLDRLVNLRSYLEGHERALQYAECWGLVWFFFHGARGDYASRFLEFMAQLKKEGQTSVKDFFDLEKIQPVWIDELRKVKVGTVKVRPEMRSIQSDEE